MPLTAYPIPAGGVPLIKFGQSENADSGVPTDIWDRANVTHNQAIWVAPTAPRIHSIVSTNANDTIAGSGARRIRISGLIAWDQPEAVEYVDMDGLTPVNTANEYVIIHRMKVDETAGTQLNIGFVTATAATDNTVTAQLNVGNGQTRMAIYGLPSTHELYMTAYQVSALRATGAATHVDVSVLINESPQVQQDGYIAKNYSTINTSANTTVSRIYHPYFKVRGPAIVKLQAESSSNNTDVFANFDAVVMPKAQ